MCYEGHGLLAACMMEVASAAVKEPSSACLSAALSNYRPDCALGCQGYTGLGVCALLTNPPAAGELLQLVRAFTSTNIYILR